MVWFVEKKVYNLDKSDTIAKKSKSIEEEENILGFNKIKEIESMIDTTSSCLSKLNCFERSAFSNKDGSFYNDVFEEKENFFFELKNSLIIHLNHMKKTNQLEWLK
jgi:hypothetical protein